MFHQFCIDRRGELRERPARPCGCPDPMGRDGLTVSAENPEGHRAGCPLWGRNVDPVYGSKGL